MDKDRRSIKVFTQLVREFIGPFLVAAAWTTAKIWDRPNWPDGIANFSTAFFLASWALGQVFRVKKQQQVELSLEKLQTHTEKLIGDLNEAASKLEGHLTGGDSYVYAFATLTAPNVAELIVGVQGKYVVSSVGLQISDSAEIAAILKTATNAQQIMGAMKNLNFPTLKPNLAFQTGAYFPLRSPHTQLNINANAVNGATHQVLGFRFIDSRWVQARKVMRDSVVIHEFAEGIWPRNADGTVDWSPPAEVL